MATEDDDFRTGYYGEASKRFEELGETTVRWMFSHNKIVPQDWQAASVWLEAKERRTISTQARALAAAETEAAAAVKQAKIAARSAANDYRNRHKRDYGGGGGHWPNDPPRMTPPPTPPRPKPCLLTGRARCRAGPWRGTAIAGNPDRHGRFLLRPGCGGERPLGIGKPGDLT